MSNPRNISKLASKLTSSGDISSSSTAIPVATTTTIGGVKVDGTSITINGSGVISGANTYTLPTATTSTLGGVKVDGSTITITNGVISSTAYTLPTATTSTLGGVKVDGSTITITNGVISGANTYTLPTASNTTLGGVKVDGTTITISNGVISGANTYTLPTATNTTLGGVKVDGTTITISNGVISGANTYTLPTATNTTLGGVKVDGTSITISNGVISSVGGGGSSSAYNRTSFTASAGQTVFNIIYTVNFVNVYVNGTLLDTASYTATDGTSITLLTGCAAGDLVDIFAFSNVTLGAISTATTSTLGGVKVDGTTIQINNGVISSAKVVYNKQLNFVGMISINTGTIRWFPESNITLTNMYISASNPPTSGPLSLNINKNGLTINTITLSANSYRSSNTGINISVLSTDYITVDVTASNNASDAVLSFLYTRN